MMGLLGLFDIAGSGLGAQSVRLNSIASNMANMETLSATPEEAYRARQPIFATALQGELGGGVRVTGMYEKQTPPEQRHMPGHPLANEDGYVYLSNVNPMEEMANMISASRAYQNNVEAMNTTKQLLLKTLSMGN